MEKINCIIVDDEQIAREILETYVAKIKNIHLLKSCKNVAEAFEVLHQTKVDLLLLDINMPEVSGLSLAKVIRGKTKIIFTTAYREYAVDGFDLQAVDYLLKPISFERFLQGINKFFDLSSIKELEKKELTKKTGSPYIFVRSDRKMLKLNFDDILYIESLSDYLKIYTSTTTITTRETISTLETKLPRQDFMRTHRSFIVAIQHINSYTSEWIEVNEKAIPISRSFKDIVIERLEIV